MARLGGMYGPDASFLGVPKVDLAEPDAWAGTDVLIIGAPFDGGTSHRPCLLYTSPSPRDRQKSRMPSSA